MNIYNWPRRLVSSLSPRRPGFAPGSVHVKFVGKSGTGTSFSTSSSVFPREYHSTMAHHSHISSGGWITGPLRPKFSNTVSPHRHEQQPLYSRVTITCNPSTNSGTYRLCIARLNIQQFCIFPIRCITRLRMILRVNTDYFRKQL
jgi:hypothetical protein